MRPRPPIRKTLGSRPSGRTYVPSRGDVVWLDFNPQVGREQAERRPALVLSPANYNGLVGLAVVCPITSHPKGYPFEVAIPDGGEVRGVVLADQIKSIDWRGRNAAFKAKLQDETIREVFEKASALIDPDGGKQQAEENEGLTV